MNGKKGLPLCDQVKTNYSSSNKLQRITCGVKRAKEMRWMYWEKWVGYEDADAMFRAGRLLVMPSFETPLSHRPRA